MRYTYLLSLICLIIASSTGQAKVSAGENQTLLAPTNQATLSSVAESPLNLSQIKYLWEQVEGPDHAVISTPRESATIVTFPRNGRYLFRVFATDSNLQVSDEVSVNVYSASAGGSLPVVDAGSSRFVWLPNASLSLQGKVWNNPGSNSYAWSQVQGPSIANFSQANQLATTVSFSTAGIYRIQLSVTADNGTQVDELVVQVMAASDTFGFTEQERNDYFTHDLNFEYDFEGYDWSRFSRPGPAGEHPRILFGPSDIPSISTRLNNTEIGKALKAKIESNLAIYLTGVSASYLAAYNDLEAGNTTLFDALATSRDRDQMVAMMTYEAFLALIENDSTRGSKVASALATLSSDIEARLVTARNGNGTAQLNYRVTFQEVVHRQFLGLAYDFAYNFMTSNERDAMRSMLSEATRGIWTIGLDSLPVLTANTSNWVPTHMMHCLFNTLAIEGETGYDADLYPRIVAATERFIRIGIGPDGTTYEGLGKNSIIAESLIALARRGDHLLAARPIRNHIQQYYLYTMDTTGSGFIQDGLLGGQTRESRYIDAPVLKYAFPSDPVMDFVYRNDVLSAERPNARANDVYPRFNDFNIRFPYKSMDFLIRAITAEDVIGTTPEDLRDDWETALAAVSPRFFQTFFSNFKGIMVARNDWSRGTTSLYFKNSTVTGGGHNSGDANTFLFSSAGINWVLKSNQEDGNHHSIIQVNGQNPAQGESQVIAYDDEAEASFIIGDATWLYNPATWDQSIYSYNSRHLYPYDFDWMHATQAENINVHWQTSQRYTEPALSTFVNGVRRARRLAGLVRGSRPYAVIADDIVTIAGDRDFTWQMAVPLDIGPNITLNGNEAVLQNGSTDDRLLVKLVSSAGNVSFTTDSYPADTASLYRLRATSTSPAPKFRVILYPYTDGETVPSFSYIDNTDTIIVDWGTTTDAVQIKSESDGSLSGVEILRDGSNYYDLDKDFTPDPFSLSSSSINASGVSGESLTPKTHSITLKNTGSETLTWTSSSNQSWLSLSPSSGTLNPDGTTQLTISLSSEIDQLIPGTYTGKLTISNNDESFSRVLNAMLQAAPPSQPTEEFVASSNDFDLDNTQLTFIPSGDSFVFRTQSITSLPYSYTAGDLLPNTPSVGSRWDGYWTQTPAWQDAPTIGGSAISTIHISTNGRVMMAEDAPDWTPSLSEHFGQPQIALLWTDYDFRTTGAIYYKHLPGDRVIITYEDFPNSFSSNNNNMQLEVFDDGSGMIRISYLDMGSNRGITGISDGNGIPANFSEQQANYSEALYAFTGYELWKVSHQIFDYTDSDLAPNTQLPTLLAYALGAVENAPEPPFTHTFEGNELTVDIPQPEPSDMNRQLEWSTNLIDWETINVIKTPNQFRVNVDSDQLFFRLTTEAR